jgi:two-component system, sensor histidine kinase PdtaS
MQKWLLTILLLSILSTPVWSQPIPDAKAKSWFRQLAASRPDSNRVELLLNLATFYQLKPGSEKNDIDSALLLADQAAALSTRIGFRPGSEQSAYLTCRIHIEAKDSEVIRTLIPKLSDSNKVKILLEAGMSLIFIEPPHNTDSLDRLCRQSLALGAASPYRRIKYYSYELPALYFLTFGNNEKGQFYLHQCLHFFDSSGDTQTAGDIADRVRIAYVLRIQEYLFDGNLYNGLRLGNEMVDEIEYEARPNTNDFTCFWSLARFYGQIGLWGKSLDYCRKAAANIGDLRTPAKTETFENRARFKTYAVRTEASNLCSLGHPDQALAVVDSLEKELPATNTLAAMMVALIRGDTYLKKKDLNRAENYLLKALQLSATLGTDAVFVYLPLARLYVEKAKFQQATAYVNKLLTTQKGQQKPAVQREIEQFLYKADSAAGHTSAALTHLQHYNYLNDSLSSAAKNGQLIALDLQYATEAKDRNIRAQQQHIELLTKEQELQKSQLHSAQQFRNMVIGGIILLLLLLGVVYNRYRLKQRSNRQLAEQQTVVQEKNRLLERAVEEKEGLIAEKDDLLVEKDWLVKEVHHRVKNNLQIIVSLLNMAGRYIDNKEAARCIQESKDRMYAMSLIHHKLYKSDAAETVEMSAYIRELVAYLDSNYNTARRIHFQLQVDEISLDTSVAVPVALILNEAITNTIKHAFPGAIPNATANANPNANPDTTANASPATSGADPGPTDTIPGTTGPNRGTIRVAMTQTELIHLTISDDGVGMPPQDHTENKRRSMGLNLMQALTRQLHGSFTLTGENGVSITIAFPPTAA